MESSDSIHKSIKIAEVLLLVVVVLFILYIFYTWWLYTGILITFYLTLRVVKSRNKQVLDISGKGVVITGCDTGFGHELAISLNSKGAVVFAGVLDDQGEGASKLRKIKSKRLHVVKLDVSSETDIKKAVKYVTNSCKEVWGIVNNAGFNVPGDVEMCTIEQYKKCAEVNLYGMIRITKAFLPLVRKSKGRIVSVSSVKARLSWPSDSIYMVSKYGMETISDSLRLELKKFGVNVSVVEPGNYGAATACNDARQLARKKLELDTMWNEATEEVRGTYGRYYFDNLYSRQETGLSTSAVTTEPVIEALEDALTNTSPRARYLVAGGNGLMDTRVNLARIYGFIPELVMDYLVVKMTGCDRFPVEEENKD